MSFTIQLSKSKDADILTQISHLAKSYWGYPPDWITHWKDSLTVTKAYINHPDHYLFHIQNAQNKIVGFCALCLETTYAEIEHMWILPEYMGKGLGRKLLMYTLENSLPEHFNKPIRVVSDPNALSFYEKIGFKFIGWEDSWPEGRKLPVLEAARYELEKQT